MHNDIKIKTCDYMIFYSESISRRVLRAGCIVVSVFTGLDHAFSGTDNTFQPVFTIPSIV